MSRDVTVGVFNTEPEAMMWAELLKREGIGAVVVFAGASEGPWARPSLLGNFELRVMEKDGVRAKTLLEQRPVGTRKRGRRR